MTLRSSSVCLFLVSMTVMMATSATIPYFLASGLHIYRDSNLLRKIRNPLEKSYFALANGDFSIGILQCVRA